MSKFRIVDQLPDEPKTSRFLVTVNTNKAFMDEALYQAAKRDLRERLDEILGNFENYLIAYRTSGPAEFTRLDLEPEEVGDLIRDATVEIHLETGKKKHRLHSHSLVTVTHDADIAFKVNLPVFRDKLPPGYLLRVKFITDHNFNLLNYIRKDVAK